MPAHRLRKKPKKKNYGVVIKLLIILVVIVGIFYFWKTRTWVGDSKLTLAISNNQDVVVGVFDPVSDEIYTLAVPGSTQVEVSRRLGEMRLSSIWQLGEDEGVDGLLLSETIIKNFRIPATYWADGDALGFVGKGSIVTSLLRKYDTNLSFSDKVRLFLFGLKVKEFKRTEIDLAKTSYLTSQKMVDGEMGYKIADVVPQKIALISSDNLIVKKNLKILLSNLTGNIGFSEKVGKIIEATGTKISAVENKDREDIDCVISGKESEVVKRFARLLGCSQKRAEGNFDVEITIGTKFAERF
jgi:hypothetical protein